MSLFIYIFLLRKKKKKRVNGGELSWHLLPERDHNDILFAGPELMKARDPNES